MANKTVAERVIAVITDQLADTKPEAAAKANITVETNVETQLHFNSLDNEEIVMRLEEEFGFYMPDDDFINCKTVAEFVVAMEKQQRVGVKEYTTDRVHHGVSVTEEKITGE